MIYTSFHEDAFRQSVFNAMEKVRAVLGTEKHPQLAEDDADHLYDDKYALAEFLSNTSVAAQLVVFEKMGLTQEDLDTVLKWVYKEKATVTLRFEAEDGCSFLKEEEVKVVMDEIHTETTTRVERQFFATNRTEKNKHKIVQMVKQNYWSVTSSFKISLHKANDPQSAIELQSRAASTVIVTSGGQATPRDSRNHAGKPVPPIAEKTVHPATEAQVTWLFRSVDPKSLSPQFSIDRSSDACKTPRRNPAVDEAFQFHQSLVGWVRSVSRFFLHRIGDGILAKHNPVKQEEGSETPPASLDSVTAESLFTPILPLLEKGRVLAIPDANALVEAQKQSIESEVQRNIEVTFPASNTAKLASQVEAKVVLLCAHWRDIISHYQNGVGYLENLLKTQLVNAIGKEVKAEDFDAFIRFWNQKLFDPKFAPVPFTQAIRQKNRYPDGILSIEALSSKDNDSIETMARYIPGTESPPIHIPINAATSIEMTGDRWLHGWMQHRFRSSNGPEEASPTFRVAARARQFSSFMLMVGTMAGSNKFEPKAAIILQNKDEVLIPLLTNVLPTAQEFKDAIASLSPEQQDFCHAFRSMQLESSVFALCVLKIKPQLEKLLGLPTGSLTKEIQLTQDLMTLFVDYQIPSDLLSYEGGEDAPVADKLDTVKGHVKAVMDVIVGEKEKQLQEEERKAEMREGMQAFGGNVSSQEALLLRSLGGEVREQNGFLGAAERTHGQAFKKRGHSFGMGSRKNFLMSAAASCSASPPPSKPTAIAQSKEVGASTLEELERQRNVIVSIDREVGRVDNNLAQESIAVPVSPENTAVPVSPTSDPVLEMDTPKSSLLAPVQQYPLGDFTMVPKLLDAKFSEQDTDNALRSTILSTGPSWSCTRQENLLSKPKTSSLNKSAIEDEKNKAFDLLDAISRSGTLPLECAELHVIVAVSHCFENDLLGTVIQDSVNPIEKVEKSSLMLASVIFAEHCQTLLAESQVGRLTSLFPSLFIGN